jgi:hypothetical protein
MHIKPLSSRRGGDARAVPHALGNMAIRRKFHHGMRCCTSLAEGPMKCRGPSEWWRAWALAGAEAVVEPWHQMAEEGRTGDWRAEERGTDMSVKHHHCGKGPSSVVIAPTATHQLLQTAEPQVRAVWGAPGSSCGLAVELPSQRRIRTCLPDRVVSRRARRNASKHPSRDRTTRRTTRRPIRRPIPSRKRVRQGHHGWRCLDLVQCRVARPCSEKLPRGRARVTQH